MMESRRWRDLNIASSSGCRFRSWSRFAIVALFKIAEGPVKFHGPGFNFEGASGEIVMWFICFAILALTIGLLPAT